MRTFTTLAVLPLILAAGLLTGCGDSGMEPQLEPTHFLVSVKMSSITAVEDCESSPGNPGDYRYTLSVHKTDELGNRVTIGSYGPDALSVGDESTTGSSMTPIEFLMPREPGATFQVEYTIGEYDPAPDFEKHGWVNHVYDRREDHEWAAGSNSYDVYQEQEDGSKYGILKFVVWSERGDCKGYARYIVRWTPVWPDQI